MLSIAIQAGGESRRMGQDKALVPFMGRALIERVIERMDSLAGEILITTNHPQALAFLGFPCFPDILPGKGALGGLYTALSVARYDSVAVVACDMPFANAQLLAALAEAISSEQADAAVPQAEKGYEPFHAVYRRSTCLPAISEAIEKGETRLISWFPHAKVIRFSPQQITRYDPQGRAFFNVNTAEDLAQAVAIAGGDHLAGSL